LSGDQKAGIKRLEEYQLLPLPPPILPPDTIPMDEDMDDFLEHIDEDVDLHDDEEDEDTNEASNDNNPLKPPPSRLKNGVGTPPTPTNINPLGPNMPLPNVPLPPPPLLNLEFLKVKKISEIISLVLLFFG
jgi:hypothetical protein